MKILIEIVFSQSRKIVETRGHEVRLVKYQCRLDIRKYSFSQRTINEWNKLSTDFVTASSMNMFKNKVDTYLRRASYTQMKHFVLSVSNGFLVYLPSGPLPWMAILLNLFKLQLRMSRQLRFDPNLPLLETILRKTVA